MPSYSLFPEDLDHVLNHTRDLWEDMRGQRLFITGGTGFFGMWLVESFLWANEKLRLNAEAVILSRNPDAFVNKAPHLAANRAISYHVGDVRQIAFPQGSFSHVIHAATDDDSQIMKADPLQVFDVNVEGSRRVLEFARQSGVRRFLFTSSGAVYGRQPPDLERIPEDYAGGPDPIDTQSTYAVVGEAKRAAESLCALYSRQFGLETVIARCFTFVGPHLSLDGKFAIGNFIRDAMGGGPIRVSGDGTPLRSYLDAVDLTIWLWTILLRGSPRRAYNVGSALPISIGGLAELVAQQVSPRCAVHIAAQPDPARPGQRYVPDVTRATSEHKLDETVDLVSAVRRTIAWHRALTG